MNLQTDNGLDIRYQHSGDELQVALKGRLDTLSAPKLMELFDRLCANALIREIFSEVVTIG